MTPSDDALVPARARSSTAQAADALSDRYRAVRAHSLHLAQPLSPEDRLAQSMPDCSPTKWHLAHTTWFFETFVLAPNVAGYVPFDPAFGYLFNSYYEAVGPRHPRPARGLITRPSSREVTAYREHVDREMERLLARRRRAGDPRADRARPRPRGAASGTDPDGHPPPLLPLAASTRSIRRPRPAPVTRAATSSGCASTAASPRSATGAGGSPSTTRGRAHRVFLAPYELSSRLVTNGEWLRFMEDGGYRRHEFWHADGWARVREEGWSCPLYWRNDGGIWREMTLAGSRSLDLVAPVGHVSFYEAGAYAAWAGARLPTEAEWEHAATDQVRRVRTAGRFGLAVDRQRLSAPPGLRRVRGRGGRVQRQVHGRPDGAQGRSLRHAPGPCAADLPQLLLSPSALDVLRRPARPRRGGPRGDLRRSGESGAVGAAQDVVVEMVLRRPGLRAVRGDLRDAGILSDAPGDGAAHRRSRRSSPAISPRARAWWNSAAGPV